MSNSLKKLLLLGLFVGVLSAQESRMTLHILYTQNNNGEIDNCHCPSNPLGGFEKRSTFFHDWVKKYPNTLIFDTGDFLSFEGEPEADLDVIELMTHMNYSAVNLGDQELSNGVSFMESYLIPSNLLLVSSNMKIDCAEATAVNRYLTFTTEGLNVVVTGLAGSVAVNYFTESDINDRVWCIDPLKSLTHLFQEEPGVKDADLHILLSNLGLDQDLELAGELLFLDVILGGHSQHLLGEALQKGGALIVQSGKDGHYVGHLELNISGGKIIASKHELIPMGAQIRDDEKVMEIYRSQ